MPRQRINLREILPPTWVAVHTTASGRKGATRWEIYDGADIYRGDLVRWMPESTWSWQEYTGGDAAELSDVTGTINEITAAIFKLAESL